MFASFAPATRGVRSVSSRCPLGVVVNSVPWGLASGHGGRAFRVAGVGLRMHVRAQEGTGGWIRVAGIWTLVHVCFTWQVWGKVAVQNGSFVKAGLVQNRHS